MKYIIWMRDHMILWAGIGLWLVVCCGLVVTSVLFILGDGFQYLPFILRTFILMALTVGSMGIGLTLICLYTIFRLFPPVNRFDKPRLTNGNDVSP